MREGGFVPGDERARLWERAVAIYRPSAPRTERTIPVVVLEPAG